MQLNLFWILSFVFIIFIMTGGTSALAAIGLIEIKRTYDRVFGIGSLTIFAIGIIGLIITIGLMLGGVLERFENKEEHYE